MGLMSWVLRGESGVTIICEPGIQSTAAGLRVGFAIFYDN